MLIAARTLPVWSNTGAPTQQIPRSDGVAAVDLLDVNRLRGHQNCEMARLTRLLDHPLHRLTSLGTQIEAVEKRTGKDDRGMPKSAEPIRGLAH